MTRGQVFAHEVLYQWILGSKFVMNEGFVRQNIVKKFLEIDYPRSKATGYYANFLTLRVTRISNNKRPYGNPGLNSEEFF